LKLYLSVIACILILSGILLLISPKTLIKLGEYFNQKSSGNGIITDYFIYSYRHSIGIILIALAIFLTYTTILKF